MTAGTLYLIPAALGATRWERYLPPTTREHALGLDYFLAENPKSARAELKRLGIARPLQEIEILTLPQKAGRSEIDILLRPVLEGRSAGVISEAGCPGVADPGAALVRAAHEIGLSVVPLVGPSSLLLALMASGLNGQSFAFCGYLPVKEAERRGRIMELERESRHAQRTQIFIETPYRNRALYEALLDACQPATLLCLATNLTLASESVMTHTVAHWRTLPPPDVNRQPTVFLLLAE